MKLFTKFENVPNELKSQQILYIKSKKLRYFFNSDKNLSLRWRCEFKNFKYSTSLTISHGGQDFYARGIDNNFITAVDSVLNELIIKLRVEQIKNQEDSFYLYNAAQSASPGRV